MKVPGETETKKEGRIERDANDLSLSRLNRNTIKTESLPVTIVRGGREDEEKGKKGYKVWGGGSLKKKKRYRHRRRRNRELALETCRGKERPR